MKRLYYYLENFNEVLWKEEIEPCYYFGTVSFSENPDLDWYRHRVTFKECEWFSSLHRAEYLRKIYVPKRSFGRLPEKEIAVVNQDGDPYSMADIRNTRFIVHPVKQHEAEWVSFGIVNFKIEEIEEIR